jgi:hypothetical protein
MTAATASAPPGSPTRGLLARVALAGLAGAAVDFVYATAVGLIDGRGPVRVWQGVASAWLGKAARDGGLASASLGLATHIGIATCMAGVYALAAVRLPILYRRPLLMGALYGLPLYGVMYRIVLPLRWPGVFPRWDGVKSGLDVLAHVGVGLAIAFVLSRRPTLAQEGAQSS